MLIFIFIFEELQKNNLLGISVDTIFTTLVTIFIFILGYIIAKNLESRKERKRLEEVSAFFFSVIKKLQNPIEKLIKSYKELSKNIADQNPKDFSLGESHELYLNSINSLSKVDLFKILILNTSSKNREEKLKNYKDLFDTFEFLNLQNDRVKKNLIYFNTEYKNYVRQWNENINLILRIFDDFMYIAKSNEVPPSEDQFLKQLDKIIHDSSLIKNREIIDVAKIHLIDPIYELCKQYSRDQRSNILMPYTINCRIAFADYKNIKVSFSVQYEEEANKLSKIENSFLISVKYFDRLIQ